MNADEMVQKLVAKWTSTLPPCPMCSYYRADHLELQADALSIPIVTVARNGTARLVGTCQHAKRLFGPYRDGAAAARAWEEEVARLAAQKAQRAAELEATISRLRS